MTHQEPTSRLTFAQPDPVRNIVAGIATIAAGALLFVSGVLAILQGISALASDDLLIAECGGPQRTGWVFHACGDVSRRIWPSQHRTPIPSFL